jgi:hypothetical protein
MVCFAWTVHAGLLRSEANVVGLHRQLTPTARNADMEIVVSLEREMRMSPVLRVHDAPPLRDRLPKGPVPVPWLIIPTPGFHVAATHCGRNEHDCGYSDEGESNGTLDVSSCSVVRWRWNGQIDGVDGQAKRGERLPELVWITHRHDGELLRVQIFSGHAQHVGHRHGG